MVGALAYTSAYRCVDDDPQSTYGRVHTVVRDVIKALLENENKLESSLKPLVILAYFLGGHIMSNYIWYIHKN